MRLVIDLQGAQTGSRYRGIGRYSLALAKALAENRGEHEVVIALSGLFPDTIQALTAEFNGLLPPDNIRVWYGTGPTRERDASNQWRRQVCERIREAFLAGLNPDVILITSLFEGLGDDGIASIGVLDTRTPVAVVLYDLIPLLNPDTHFRSNKTHQDWYARKFMYLRRGAKLLTISESTRQEAIATSCFSERSVSNISGACDARFGEVALSEDERHSLHTRLGISKPFVMYTGGADERKNLHRLIRSFASLAPELRDRHQLVLVGKMPDAEVGSYVQTAKESALSRDALILPGYVSDDDLVKLYNSCALFVFPSLHEGLGLPPLEAMVCGAPVIASNATSLQEIIGLPEATFDPSSISDMTARMTRALTDAEFRSRLVAHGRVHARRFSWDRTARSAWRAMLELGPRRAGTVSPILRTQSTALFRRRTLKILVIKLDHLGDFLLAIPALSKLRARFPYATIDIVVGSWNVELARELRLFSHIEPYDFFSRRSTDAPGFDESAISAVLRDLGTYDIAIDLRRQTDTRFLLARVSATTKIAYETKFPSIDQQLDVALETHRDVAFTTTPFNLLPVTAQLLRLVDAIPSDINDYIAFPAIGQVDAKQPGTVAIFPKSGNSAREWESSRFRELVDLLRGNPTVRGISIYVPTAEDARTLGLTPDTTLELHIGLEFPALVQSLSRNVACVTNNSGGAHLASYLGLRVIAIFSGHELPSEWAPQFFDGTVIHRAAMCAPCHGKNEAACPNGLFCLNDITVQDVYPLVADALSVDFTHHSAQVPPLNPAPSVQRTTDVIVRGLLASIAGLKGGRGRSALRELSIAIAKNHPTFVGGTLSAPDPR